MSFLRIYSAGSIEIGVHRMNSGMRNDDARLVHVAKKNPRGSVGWAIKYNMHYLYILIPILILRTYVHIMTIAIFDLQMIIFIIVNTCLQIIGLRSLYDQNDMLCRLIASAYMPVYYIRG